MQDSGTANLALVLLSAASLSFYSAAAIAEDPEPEKPRAAEIAKLAEKTTLLSLANTGKGLVAVGQRGHILNSSEGNRWVQAISPHNSMLTRVRFADSENGWAVGHDALIINTNDGGQSWQLQNFDPNARALYDIHILSAQHLIALGGYGTYLVSRDGGKTWAQEANPVADLGYHLNAMIRTESGSLFLIGERGLLARSKDLGKSWELINSPYAGSLFGALPYGKTGVLAYGMRGNVYLAKDLDSVETQDFDDFDPFMKQTVTNANKMNEMGWQHIPPPIKESLFGGSWRGDSALLVGVNGTAMKFSRVDNSLTLLDAPADETLSDAIWTDQWLAVGRRGIQPLGTLGWGTK